MRSEIEGKYVLQKLVIGAVFECLCPAKIQETKGFLEKTMGQKGTATIRFWRFGLEGASGNVGFCDCGLEKQRFEKWIRPKSLISKELWT